MTVYDFNWNDWLPFFVLVFTWLGLLYFSEKKKDVVTAMVSLFVGLMLYVNTIAASVFTILGYNLSVVFAILSIYEFFIIALKR